MFPNIEKIIMTYSNIILYTVILTFPIIHCMLNKWASDYRASDYKVLNFWASDYRHLPGM